MSSVNYQRAQTMVLCDKYDLNKSQFYAELAQLANKYFDVEGIYAELERNVDLQVRITLKIKKVKPRCNQPS